MLTFMETLLSDSVLMLSVHLQVVVVGPRSCGASQNQEEPGGLSVEAVELKRCADAAESRHDDPNYVKVPTEPQNLPSGSYFESL